MARAYVAMGSNLGDRQAYLKAAVAGIAQLPCTQVLAISSALETAPVGGPAHQGRYLNAALAVNTKLEPTALLQALLHLEQQAGRQRHEPSGPRTLDMDLLLYDQAIIANPPQLAVPHPRMHQRRFVLEPLAQIAPHAIHPTLQKTIAQLLKELA